MGKLYDSQDLKWNTALWDRVEVQLYADISAGLLPKAILKEIMTYSAAPGQPKRYMSYAESFEHERKRERGKLFRTGLLLSELHRQEALFKACTECHYRVGKKGSRKGRKIAVPCNLHKDGFKKAKSDVWWAGERNVAERLERGQVRDEPDVAIDTTITDADRGFLKSVGIADTDEPHNGLNEWERMHLEAKLDGSFMQDVEFYDVEPTYKGYLNILLQEGEMTEKEYLDEMRRLREAAQQAEESAVDRLAGRDGLKLTARQRDTRHNRLVN